MFCYILIQSIDAIGVVHLVIVREVVVSILTYVKILINSLFLVRTQMSILFLSYKFNGTKMIIGGDYLPPNSPVSLLKSNTFTMII